jgi:short-subunit dehydrogenase
MARREIRHSRVIVTGASSGIGRALALELARNGAELVVTARREDRLRELAGEIAALGGQVESVVGDLCEPDTRRAVIEAVERRFGGLDILVNNAGAGALGLFEHADAERLRRVMEVNFFSLVEMTRQAFPLLRRGTNPMLVNLSSIIGHRGVPYNSEYCASKFAVRGFSESIRTEWTRHGIDVLVVCPGTTQTEFFDRVIERTGQPTWPEHTAVSAERVSQQIVWAMRRGKAEIIPYGWGRILCWLNRLSPRLMDRIMARYV